MRAHTRAFGGGGASCFGMETLFIARRIVNSKITRFARLRIESESGFAWKIKQEDNRKGKRNTYGISLIVVENNRLFNPL